MNVQQTNLYRLVLVQLIIFVLFLQSIHSQENKDSLDFYVEKLSNKDSLPIATCQYYYHKAQGFATVMEQINLLEDEAECLRQRGNPKESKYYYQKAISIASKNDLKIAAFQAYFQLSSYYYQYNQYKLSYKTLLHCKRLIEELTSDDFEKHARLNHEKPLTRDGLLEPVLFNTASITVDYGQLDEAEMLFKEALKIYQNNKDTLGIIYSKINLANLLLEKTKYKESEKAFIKIKNNPDTPESEFLIINYNLSWIYYELKEYKLALNYINKCNIILQKEKDLVMQLNVDYVKGEILIALHQLDEARFLLENVLKETIKINDKEFEIDVYKALIKILNKRKKPLAANDLINKVFTIQDSIETANQINAYNEIFFEEELLNQERINQNQKRLIKDERKRGNLFLGLIVLSLLFMLTLISFIITSRKNNDKRMLLKEQEAEMKTKEFENKENIEILEKEKIQEALNAKKRELLHLSLSSQKRKKIIVKFTTKINGLKAKSIITKSDLNELQAFIIQRNDELDKNENLSSRVNDTHKNFFINLVKDFPTLTKTELKILSFYRIGLSTNEIAGIQFVSIDAIRKTRHRIRKKLNLDPQESLEKFIFKYV